VSRGTLVERRGAVGEGGAAALGRLPEPLGHLVARPAQERVEPAEVVGKRDQAAPQLAPGGGGQRLETAAEGGDGALQGGEVDQPAGGGDLRHPLGGGAQRVQLGAQLGERGHGFSLASAAAGGCRRLAR
jgi:hypothetical protein